MLEIIHADARQDGEELERDLARDRFEEDRARLRDWFAVDLRYDRSLDEYELINIDRPLIDLPEDGVQGLAFLEQTFNDNSAPMAGKVRSFLNIVMMLLPQDSRNQVEKQRGLLEMELGVRDEDEINANVWEAVKISVSERRCLEFDYMASRNQDGILRRHLVEPLRYFFDTERKHYYLEFIWLESRSPHKGIQDQNRKIGRFRLGRMSNPLVLMSHFPANQRIPTKELIYELQPIVARLGVTRHFPEMNIIYHEDGSARVHVKSRDLFFDLRTLLYYGANCRVIGGDEAVMEMRKLATSLASLYPDE